MNPFIPALQEIKNYIDSKIKPADLSKISPQTADPSIIYLNNADNSYEKGMLYKVYLQDDKMTWVKFATDNTVVYRKNTTSDRWVINHNLNKLPVNVIVKDSAGSIIIPDISYKDNNTIELLFAFPTTGSAYIN